MSSSCTCRLCTVRRAFLVLLLACLSLWCRTALAQEDLPLPDEDRVKEILARLKPVGELIKRRLDDEERQRSSLDRKVSMFVVTNAPLYHVVDGLRALGVPLCVETIPAEQDWYIDGDGVPAFAADKLISMAVEEATVRSILDRICAADPRYQWRDETEHGLVVLEPKEHSRLGFFVGAVKDSGNPVEVLRRVDQISGTALAPLVSKGDNNLPDIALDAPRCSARNLLNLMASQRPGLTWGFAGRVLFSYLPHTSANAVRIEFPEVRKGRPTNGSWRYSIVERRVEGIPTMTVEKRKLTVPIEFASAPQQLAEAAAAAVQRDVRAEEQNVVASRLAGSWKVDGTLTERLTGKAGALDSTLEFVSDPEVKKKVPARFTDAAKQEGVVLDIRMAGYMVARSAKFPFILATYQGNPHVFYFREQGGDPFGDSESFNVMLASAKDRKNDLLFIGGDFNNQPFVAYARTDAEK